MFASRRTFCSFPTYFVDLTFDTFPLFFKLRAESLRWQNVFQDYYFNYVLIKCQLSGSDRLAGLINFTEDNDFIYREIKAINYNKLVAIILLQRWLLSSKITLLSKFYRQQYHLAASAG